ncbi:MAG: zinc-binding dehydrogenase [Pseudomonadota bacterium]|nr:zinc-binding dehydrogenase [Pseudomonadota bacterium]
MMTTGNQSTQLQLRSLVHSTGHLELSLAEIPIPSFAANEVLVRIEAAPLNPSDLRLLFGAADMATARASGTALRPVVTADIKPAGVKAMTQRLGQSLPVGNEGAGIVVGAGDSPDARALLGKTVAVRGGAMYSQYRNIAADQCLVLPDGVTSVEGASAFINPMTALGMMDTMRSEGHTALVNTAAASNLGQMLNRLCIEEQVALVNIVRDASQERLLRDSGAAYVCNSRAEDFWQQLTEALVATGATIAFDATGGGSLASDILNAMEAAAGRRPGTYSRYGSTVHKQVYLYGNLDPRPTVIDRDAGMAWSVGGWLVSNFMQKCEPAKFKALKLRIAQGIKTTFASHYAKQLALRDVLALDMIAEYQLKATGQKFLVAPNVSRAL